MPSKRDKNGRFTKGNPGGPGRKPVSQQMRELADLAPERLRAMVDDPNVSDVVRFNALKMAWEAVHGKPKQSVDVDATAAVAVSQPLTLAEMREIASQVVDGRGQS